MESDSFVLLGEGAILGPCNVSGVQPGTKEAEKKREKEMGKKEEDESIQRLAEWRGRSHSTRDRQQRERVAVGLPCIYIFFFAREIFLFSGGSTEHAHLLFLTITLDSSETRAPSSPKETHAAFGLKLRFQRN